MRLHPSAINGAAARLLIFDQLVENQDLPSEGALGSLGAVPDFK
jgi:hypothetical protein